MTNYSKKLSKILAFVQESVSDLVIQKEPKNLYSPINYIVNNQGKNIRSVLALITHDMFDGNIHNLRELILAIEGLHNFTLIHDDVMDNAALRRGRGTINKKWSKNQAILSGDVLLIKSYQHLMSLKTQNDSIIKKFTDTAVLICEGQQLDFDFQSKKKLTKMQYFNMIELKTSALIIFSLVAPCFLTEMGRKNIAIMGRLGNILGCLFQIQDDYLDLYGNSKETGKVIGGDIVEMKKNFLYITALQAANKKQQEELINLYHDNNAKKTEQIVKLYHDLGVRESVQHTIQKLNHQLKDLINVISVPDSKKTMLIEFINILSKRKT